MGAIEMPVGIKVGVVFTEVEPPGLLNAFFSTIGHRLEPSGWGNRFPYLLNRFFQGRLESNELETALDELRIAKQGLIKLPASDIVWDIENISVPAPWGNNAPRHITNLAQCFVTTSKKDLFALIENRLRVAKETNSAIQITFVKEF